MTSSPRLSLLVLLLACAALAEPVSAGSRTTAPSAQPALDLEGRLTRLSEALRARFESGTLPGHLDGALARGFVNGPRGGFANAAYRGGFANAHPYYGGPARGFVNGGGGYYGGGFVNARPGGAGFVNW